MRDETTETTRPLRYGYTTGACATAVSLGAANLLLSDTPLHQVSITLPRGQTVDFELAYCRCSEGIAEAGTIKDAGDDPDVTHGALIFAQVRLTTQEGVRFFAGPGIGTVTRPGLPVAVGEPAINPTPRRMLTQQLQALAQTYRYSGGFEVTLGIENGAALAAKTMNPRLGIEGGLSILGTTGIVRPFSCAAYIASIHQAIDVARANGLHHIAACTGAASEQAIRTRYSLTPMALIEMGDFVGAVLKHLRIAPVAKLSLVGGFGKISKLAAGHLNLHSHHSAIDFNWLASQLALLGADEALQGRVQTANTAQQVLAMAQEAGLPLGDQICRLAQQRSQEIVRNSMAIEVWVLSRQGEAVGYAAP